MLCLYKDSLLSSLGTIIFYLEKSKNLLIHLSLFLLSCNPFFIQQPQNFKKKNKQNTHQIPFLLVLKLHNIFPLQLEQNPNSVCDVCPNSMIFLLLLSFWLHYGSPEAGLAGFCPGVIAFGLLDWNAAFQILVSSPQTLWQFSDFRQHFSLV